MRLSSSRRETGQQSAVELGLNLRRKYEEGLMTSHHALSTSPVCFFYSVLIDKDNGKDVLLLHKFPTEIGSLKGCK
jgi:hypothetical protein